ncbi:MAG: hypothetical protein R3Y46_05920 [Opitutales bacterium]
MFKKILVCFAFVICSTLWGDESIATKAELEAFEELALTDANRALELSMYYQGWSKDECFYVFDNPKSDSPITRDYVKDSELSRQLKMRDFDKALHFAEIAFEILPVDEKLKGIKKKTDLNLMKLYILRGEDFAEETFNFFVEKVASHNFEKEGKLYGTDLYRKFDGPPSWAFKYKELHVYFYAKGFGVKQDMAFAKDLLHQVTGNENWRAFYLPKYYIKDLEFMEFLMEESEGNIRRNYYLHLIYAGRFNEEEKDEARSDKYFDLYEEAVNNITDSQIKRIEESLEKNKQADNFWFLSFNYAEKYLSRIVIYDKCLIIYNPYYNIEFLIKYINKTDNTAYKKHLLIAFRLLNAESVVDAKKYLNKALESDNISYAEKNMLKEEFYKQYERRKNTFYSIKDYGFDMLNHDYDSF